MISFSSLRLAAGDPDMRAFLDAGVVDSPDTALARFSRESPSAGEASEIDLAIALTDGRDSGSSSRSDPRCMTGHWTVAELHCNPSKIGLGS